MGTKILKIGLLITATQFLFANSCKKNNSGSVPCTQVTPYSFDVTSTFSPQKEIYNIGDTIYLESNFQKNLLNLISNQQVDYSNSLSVGGTIGFGLMDTIQHSTIAAYSKFQVVPKIGTFTQIINVPENGVSTSYLESTSYQFKIGIIVKQKGLFVLGVNDLASQGIIGQNCTNANFNMTVSNSNKHFNLFQYALGYPPDVLMQKSIYCFRVQ